MWELVERTREHSRKTLKTEMAPWAKECAFPLQEVEFELRKQGEFQVIEDYTELFTGLEDKTRKDKNENSKKVKLLNAFAERDTSRMYKGQKILVKGNYGSGKSTLAKKVAHDWAKETVRIFSIVFYISLNQMRTDDTIEKAMIDQIPVQISEEKLLHFLNSFGHKCLLVLDGFEYEYVSQNADLFKILTGQKMLFSNVLVTSRVVLSEIQYFRVFEMTGFSRKRVW